MRRTALLLALAALLAVSCGRQVRVTEDFNFDWTFSLGDDAAWAQPGFDDSSWRQLHLPHDWSVEGEFSADNPSTPGGGALPGGIGWYRKHFPTPAGTDRGRKCFVEFDGVFMNSTVYVNGKAAGTRPYGYSSFRYDITGMLNEGAGADNVIAVRCDNAEQPNSRWYAGCGIYRNVRLVTTGASYVDYNGIFVTTPEVSAEKARVHIDAEVAGASVKDVSFRIIDQEGRKVASAKAAPAGEGLWSADIDIASPVLWDIKENYNTRTRETYLYTVQTTVKDESGVSDAHSQRFGIRTLGWDKDKGFMLNGRYVKLLGVCLHHDMGCLGTAVHRRALERELGILKDMGCNAIRTSHNPPAPELLELADEMGFLVMDEAMDMWRRPKTRYDYSRFFDEWHVADVQDFVKRDRNHPSVIMWSIGNEIPEQGGNPEANQELSRHMAALIRDLDDTRAITAGCNDTGASNNIILSGALDVYGFNYHTWDYDILRERYPDTPLLGSETASSLNSRGFYPQPSTDVQRQPREWWLTHDSEHHQCTSYDALCAPWADLHEHAWVSVRDRDWMAGCFVWTGFDYLGEPTPYGWPSRSSYFGIVDLAGFPKDIYYMYQAEWSDNTVAHLFPHWNWEEGDTVDLWCYYNHADAVDLYINGVRYGSSAKKGEELRAQWLNVPFTPGKIEAVSSLGSMEVARHTIYTTGAPVGLKLTPDRPVIAADGYDLCYVTVEAVDKDGRVVPDATLPLEFSVAGQGELIGIDNGNAADTTSLKGNRKDMFAGKALAVVRSLRDTPGTATLSVSSPVGSVKLNIGVK